MSEKRLIASSVLFTAIEEDSEPPSGFFHDHRDEHVAVSVSWAG
ncbi:MAG: hypothetical protein ACLTCB_00020 [Merdibacter sp.]